MSDYQSISLSSALIGIWPVWYVEEPWPALALIQEYDAEVRSEGGKNIIDIDCENGSASFEVVSFDRLSGYACKLRPGSTYIDREEWTRKNTAS